MKALILCLIPAACLAFTPSLARHHARNCVSKASPFDEFIGGLKSEFGALSRALQKGGKDKEIAAPKPAFPDVVISPDFKLAIIFLALGVALDTIPYVQLTLGPLVTILGLLFLVQVRINLICEAVAVPTFVFLFTLRHFGFVLLLTKNHSSCA